MTEPSGDSPALSQAFQIQAPGPPGLDPWGRPLLSSEPSVSRTALALASARLHTWLAVLCAVLGLSGLLGALALFFGGRAGLSALALLLPAKMTTASGTDWLLGLAALLSLALSALYVAVVLWARELLRRLADWALGTTRAVAPDAARIEHLRRTLAGWLIFGQWGTVAGVLFGIGLELLILRLLQTMSESLGLAASDGFDPFGSGVEVFQLLAGAVGAIPGVVITWLILGAILRFMNLAVLRARGLRTAPLVPAAKTVSNWFLLCLILLGLEALNLLLAGAGFGVAVSVASGQLGEADSFPASLSGLLHWAGPLLVGVLLLSALVLGLYFALLLFSRSYASALAETLDRASSDWATQPPAPGLPIGSAGEHPNTFRGQF